MKLRPPNDYTIYTFKIPSTGEEKRFRPFLVKENKALMIAQATEDELVMIETLKNIIQGTCMDDIDVEQLATFDCEYLLLMLRSVSMGDTVELYFYCDAENNEFHKSEDDENRKVIIPFNLGEVSIENIEGYSRDLRLSDTLMLRMAIPNLTMVRKISELKEGDGIDDYIKVIASSIEQIITDEEMINLADGEISNEELVEWLEMLTQEQFDIIINFFKNIPFCCMEVKWKCPVCGKENVRKVGGLLSFF